MNTGWNSIEVLENFAGIINLLGNEYWLEPLALEGRGLLDYKPTGK